LRIFSSCDPFDPLTDRICAGTDAGLRHGRLGWHGRLHVRAAADLEFHCRARGDSVGRQSPASSWDSGKEIVLIVWLQLELGFSCLKLTGVYEQFDI